MKEWLRIIGELVLSPKEKKRAAIEAAIAEWENDPERSSGSLKVVRGADGLPVEIVVESESEAAFIVNGQKRPFPIADLLNFSSFNDPIPSLCLDGVLREGYDVQAVQKIDLGSAHLVVLTGIPTGMPPGLVVTQ